VSDKSWELIKKQMLMASSLTLGVLKSLYPHANLDVAGEGFAKDCDQAQAAQLIGDSLQAAAQIFDMIKIK
jgi:hypothetical protein